MLRISNVLPNFIYCLSVHEVSEPDLNIIQHFLGRCHKHRFVSFPVSIKSLLYRKDCKILKAITSVDNHPLGSKKENMNIICVKNSVPSPRLIPNDLRHLNNVTVVSM